MSDNLKKIPLHMNVNSLRRHTTLLYVVGAFLLGIIGSVVVMSWGRSSSPVPTADKKSEANKEAAPSTEKSSLIKLDADAVKTAGIRSEPARLEPFGESLTVPGTVEVSPNRAAKITPPVSGKVVRLLVSPGETVQAGQPLAVLDSYEVAQARAAVRQAEAGVQQAQASLQTAQAETAQARAGIGQAQAEIDQARTKQASSETALQRQKDLAAAGAFSQAPLHAAQTELSAAQSELLQAQTSLQAKTVVVQRAERLFKEELVSRAELEQAQLEQRQDQTAVDRAKARVEIAKQALEREQKVYSGDLLTKQAVQSAEAEVRAAQGDVQRARQGYLRAQQDVRRAEQGEQAARTALKGAEASLSAARTNQAALVGGGASEQGGLLTLRAPFGGTITERQATSGEAVERSTPLFVLENLNTVLISAGIPEKEVGRVRSGQQVQVAVAAYPNQVFTGVVESIGGRVDEKTRALPVRCVVENRGGKLRPEMFARVALGTGNSTRALSVPVAALDQDGEERFLYVESDGGYEKRKVQVGRTTETRAEITQGLKPGERVVIEGVFVLKSESKKGELKGDD